MKLLVTGASGYLGRRLCRLAAPRHELYAGYSLHRGAVVAGTPVLLDLRQPQAASARICELSPQAIVHTAAVNPGGPESEMVAVNVEGSRAVATAAAALGASLVHVSTDVVHDGKDGPYADDAPPSPVGLYARTKAEAETAVLHELPTAAVVRTSLIYGLHEIDHGTAGFAARLRAGQPVQLFADVVRQPVWVETLAEALLRLVHGDHQGYFNVAGSQALSRDAFGRRMLEWWQVPLRERVESVRVAELAWPVPRNLRLRLVRARKILAIELPGVDEVLARSVGNGARALAPGLPSPDRHHPRCTD